MIKAARLLVVAFAVILMAAGSRAKAVVDPNSDPPNTDFFLEWSTINYGPFKVFQAGVGLGGFDVDVCYPSTLRTLRLDWSTVPATTVWKAFLVFQASSDLDVPSYNLRLDGQAMLPSASRISSGTECNHVTGDHARVLKRSDVYYKDVTNLVRSKLDNAVGNVDFAIQFTSTCPTGVSEISNGVSLIVVGRNAAWDAGTVIKLQVGGVAYDKNAVNHSPAHFHFDITPEGLLEGQRVDNVVMHLGLVVGEGENQSGENPEGYTINGGVFKALVIDGKDGINPNTDGPKWDTKDIDIWDCDAPGAAGNPCVQNADTAVDVAFQSQRDCLIFVALVLEYSVNFDNSKVDVAEDPHITTWDGIKATLQSEGDYVLVQSLSTGLEVHTRFAKNRRGPWAPWTTAVAARCSTNAGFVEIQASSFSQPKVNGEGVNIVKIDERITRVICEETGLVMTAMRFRFHRLAYMNIRIEKNANLPKDVRGLLGSPNGNVLDDLASRDGLRFVHEGKNKGHFIGHNRPELLAVQASWKVQETENMFSTPFQAAESPKGPAAMGHGFNSVMSREEARRECKNAGIVGSGDMLACIHDATLTGSTAGAANLAEFKYAMHEVRHNKAYIPRGDKAAEFAAA